MMTIELGIPESLATLKVVRHVEPQEFLRLAVSHRRLTRRYDAEPGLCVLEDLDSGEQFVTDSARLASYQITHANKS